MRVRDHLQQMLEKDPEFREVYERTRPAFHVRRAIVRARVGAGLTQEQLAERLGTTQATVARWENGKHVPTPLTLHRLAKELGVEFVITGTEALSVRPAAGGEEAAAAETPAVEEEVAMPEAGHDAPEQPAG